MNDNINDKKSCDNNCKNLKMKKTSKSKIDYGYCTANNLPMLAVQFDCKYYKK
jgi:hypothetical protein